MLIAGATLCLIGSFMPLLTLVLREDPLVYFVLTIGSFLSGVGSTFYKMTFLILMAIFMKKKNLYLGVLSVYFF